MLPDDWYDERIKELDKMQRNNTIAFVVFCIVVTLLFALKIAAIIYK